MPKIVDRERQRQDIRTAAWKVFAARGIEGVGLTHVADEAGLGRSSLYHYYPDKDALVRDLAAELLEREAALFDAALSRDGSAIDRIVALAGDLTALVDEWATVGPLLLDLRRLDPEPFRAFSAHIRETLAALIVDGRERGEIAADVDPGPTAAALIGLAEGLMLQKILDPASFHITAAFGGAVTAWVRRSLVP